MRERADAYRPHIVIHLRCAVETGGRRLGCAEVPSLAAVGVTYQKPGLAGVDPAF